jgi:Rieske Fe-S protein
VETRKNIAICKRGEQESVAQQANKKKSWLESVAACEHRGCTVSETTSKQCGQRGNPLTVFHCNLFGKLVTIEPSGRTEIDCCKRCDLWF